MGKRLSTAWAHALQIRMCQIQAGEEASQEESGS